MTEIDILDKLSDLHRQATKERSHFYVGSVATEASDEIKRLRKVLAISAGVSLKLTTELLERLDAEGKNVSTTKGE